MNLAACPPPPAFPIPPSTARVRFRRVGNHFVVRVRAVARRRRPGGKGTGTWPRLCMHPARLFSFFTTVVSREGKKKELRGIYESSTRIILPLFRSDKKKNRVYSLWNGRP
jgi:hypothetical protein